MTNASEVRVKANALLGAVGEGSWEPSSFERALFGAMLHADASNLELLGLGFPVERDLVYAYKNVDGGLDAIRAIASHKENN